jgi:hypothetical protein
VTVGDGAPYHGGQALEDEVDCDGLVDGVNGLVEGVGEGGDGREVDVGW